MRIVTNPGSNLEEEELVRWDVDLLSQKILVDGINFDTRGTIDFAKIDSWVKKSLKHPKVLGTPEADCVELFTRLARRDPELLVIMTSRKIVGSHDAAAAAIKKLKETSDLRSARFELVDSGVTDVGAGLVTLFATQARKAGLSLTDAAEACRAFAARGQSAIGLAALEYAVRGGSASWLQGWVANFLSIRPLIRFEDGVLTSAGRMSARADLAEKLTETVAVRLDAKAKVWVGIGHGNAPDRAADFLARLKERFTVEYALVRPLSTSIYLNAGPNSLCGFVFPLDGLRFRPTPPT